MRVDDYRVGVKRGLRLASAQRFTAVELAADGPEISPETLSESGRRHLARLVADEGMSLAALAQDSRGGGLADPAHMDEVVTRATRALQLAADVHVPILTHDVGDMLDLAAPRHAEVTEALRALAAQAERLGTIYAVRSRACDPQELSALVRTIACPLVRISLDPAALLMAGIDPLAALDQFGDQVVLAYVRDALRGSPGRPGHETPLGEGRLDIEAYLAGLAAGNVGVAPILRRAHTRDAAAEIAADKAYLERRLIF